jgi:hypothetical protein
LGFLLFGLGVLWLAVTLIDNWAHAATWMHLAFGVLMIGTAAFSHRPFIPSDPFDPVEGIAALSHCNADGFAFSWGCFSDFCNA